LTLERFAPALFVLLWSTGFVGAKYGLPYAGPFVFLAVRILLAAILLFALARALRMPVRIGRGAIARSGLIGFFLHACYLGGVFYSIAQGLPAGVAAVVTSLQPVLVSVSILVALMGSTTATLLQKKLGADIPLISGTAYQYLFSGCVLGIIALATQETSITWSLRFTAAFVWLVLVLSVGAILLLLWLLNTGSAAKVSSLFYLVPPATAIEAFLLFGEKVNTQGFLGIGITALGVWLVMRG